MSLHLKLLRPPMTSPSCEDFFSTPWACRQPRRKLNASSPPTQNLDAPRPSTNSSTIPAGLITGWDTGRMFSRRTPISLIPRSIIPGRSAGGFTNHSSTTNPSTFSSPNCSAWKAASASVARPDSKSLRTTMYPWQPRASSSDRPFSVCNSVRPLPRRACS